MKETASHYPVPIVFQQGGGEEEQNWEKREKRKRAEIFALSKEKIPQVFQKSSRSGDLAARLAAPQSFIDKETRPTFSPPHEFATRKRRRASRSIRPKQQSFIERRQKRKIFQKQKRKHKRKTTRSRIWRRKRDRENEETTTKETLRFHRGEWLRSFEKRRLLDLSQFTGSIRSLRRRHLGRKCQSFSFSLFRKDDAKITSTTHRWDKNQISPRTILPTPPFFLRH